jgi:hypothetical protein
MMETLILPAAIALLAKLNISTPRPGAKLDAGMVERAIASVPPSRQKFARADLQFYFGFSS